MELEKVMRNIRDPNTCDGKREITIKITLTPNAKRSKCAMDVATSCKLQPDTPFGSEMWIAMQGARPVALEDDPDQLKLPMKEGDVEALPRVPVIQR